MNGYRVEGLVLNHYRQAGFAYVLTSTLVRFRIAKVIHSLQQRGRSNVCFIWIPKTAGSSVQRWLYDCLGMRKIVDVEWVKGAFANRGAITFGHLDYLALLERGIVSRRFDSTAFKFAFVRNPFDRAASLFYYMIRVGVLDPKTSFESFLDRIRRGVEPIGLYNTKGLSQCNPQTAWLLDANGDSIVDYLGDMEGFDDHIVHLARRLKVEPGVYHENSTPRERNLDTLFAPVANVEMVREIFKSDFELLGYDSDPRRRLRQPAGS